MRKYLHSGEQTSLNAQKATGAGTAISVNEFRHKMLTLATAGMAAGDEVTIKVQGSQSKTVPTFGSAKSASNRWDYIQVVDLQNGDKINGDTGIPFTFTDDGTADVKQFAINVDGLRWICLNITANNDTTNVAVTGLIDVYND